MKSKIAKPRTKRGSLPADVRISAPREVNGYLRGHPDLLTIVPAICRRARAEFGRAAELTLQINHDPEIDDPYLVLFVRLPTYDPSTRMRIDSVWEGFEDELCGLSGWIILTTDFRKAHRNAV